MLSSVIVGSGTPHSPNRFSGESTFAGADEEKKEPTLYERFISNVYLFCLSVYAVWILLGILWYMYYDKWTSATAFYYAMDAGLSIGFCNPAEKDDWSKLFTIAYVLIGSTVISGCLGVFASVVVFAQVSVARDYSLENMTMKDPVEDKITLKSFANYAWYCFKLGIGWYSNRSRVILTIIFTIWMSLGTAYGMVFEDWSFITALYWAITTCSTGGLQSAPCINEDNNGGTTCDMGTLRGSLMGVFMMIGVPIYACTMAQFARSAVARVVESREAKLLSRPIEDAEFIFAANVLSPAGSETLVLGEYILLELMRLGQTNQNQIEKIKKNFYRLDKHKVGELFIDDLRLAGHVVSKRIRPGTVIRKIRTKSVEIFNTYIKSPSRTEAQSESDMAGGGGGHLPPPLDGSPDIERFIADGSPPKLGIDTSPGKLAPSVAPPAAAALVDLKAYNSTATPVGTRRTGKKSFRKSVSNKGGEMTPPPRRLQPGQIIGNSDFNSDDSASSDGFPDLESQSGFHKPSTKGSERRERRKHRREEKAARSGTPLGRDDNEDADFGDFYFDADGHADAAFENKSDEGGSDDDDGDDDDGEWMSSAAAGSNIYEHSSRATPLYANSSPSGSDGSNGVAASVNKQDSSSVSARPPATVARDDGLDSV